MLAPRGRALAVALALAGGALPAAPGAADLLTVTTLADTDVADGDCSLREAMVAANTDLAYRECTEGSGADEIEIAVAGTIGLVADLPQVVEALTVRGLGAADSAIDGGNTHRIFDMVNAAAGNGELLRIERLTLTGGLATEGGAIRAGRNRTLEVVDCVLVANRGTVQGGAISSERTVSTLILRTAVVANAAPLGGGLWIEIGTTEIVDSTVAGNLAESANGGGIYALLVAGLTIRQSTVSGNQAAVDGGGLSAVAGSSIRVERSTVTGNRADIDGDDDGDGGGVSTAAATITLESTVVAGNTDGSPTAALCPDGFQKLGGAVVSDGLNLVGANDCIATGFPPGLPNVNGDQVGTASAPVDPLLAPLDFHGGPTPTHLPLTGSPAIDAGGCPGVEADQRGYGNGLTGLRIVDDPGVADTADGCDVGAVEVGGIDLGVLVFLDGFESGDTGRWSSTVP